MSQGLVDLEHGAISRSIFSDDGILKDELHRVFGRSWSFVGHESQIPQPKDSVLSTVAREPVVVTRDSGGDVHVLLNSCRHRGMPVCRYDQGSAAGFTCSYHGWTYAGDGRLIGVPQERTLYDGSFERSDWGLIRARVARYYGSIWATFDSAAPSFDAFLGEMGMYVRDLMRGPDGEDDGWEVIGGVMKWRIPCNWKLGAENYAGDTYHHQSHLSVDQLSISPSGKRGRHVYDGLKRPRVSLNIAHPAGGHTVRANLDQSDSDYESLFANIPEVDEYYRRAHDERRRRLGDQARFFNRGGVVFPNMHYNTGGRTTIGVWVPLSAASTEVWRWFFVPKSAPDIVKDTLRRYYLRYAGPAGMTEQDDIENWTAAQAGVTGEFASRHPFNYALGSAQTRRGWPEPWLGADALVTEGVSEHNQRVFYGRWAALMANGDS